MTTAQNFSKAEHECARAHGTLLTLNVLNQQEAEVFGGTLTDIGKNLRLVRIENWNFLT